MAEITRRTSGGRQPITSHPLFPAIVALWCGALFGLASLALRPALIESLVLATGLDRLIPMAAPPLGATTRILIALAMTGLGGLIGLVLSRRFAAPKAEATTVRRGASAVSSPIAAFGAAGDVEPAEEPLAAKTMSGRRRRLTIPADEQSDPFHDTVPLPGTGQILKVADFDLDGFEHDEQVETDERDGWLADLGTADLQDAPAEAPGDLSLPAWARHKPFGNDPEDDDSQHADDAAPARVFDEPVGRQIFQASHEHDADTQGHQPSGNRLFNSYTRGLRIDGGPHDETPAVPGFTLLDRFAAADGAEDWPAADGTSDEEISAPSIEHVAFGENAHEEPETPDAYAIGEVPEPVVTDAHPLVDSTRADTPDCVSAAERIASAPLDELSHVELLERLALTLERRRAAAKAEAAQVQLAAPPPAEAVEPEVVPAPAAHVPFALRPVPMHTAEDEREQDDRAFAPPRRFVMPSLASAELAADADEEEVLEDGYSSLLNLSKPGAPRQSFVRIETPEPMPASQPVVIFPGQDSAAAPFSRPAAAPRGSESTRAADQDQSDETERALRAALATLQRMSGAA